MRKWIQFIKEAKIELAEKTTWPNRDSVLNSTIVVIASIVIIALLLFSFDLAANSAFYFIVVDSVDNFKQIFEWILEPVFLFLPLRFFGLIALFIGIIFFYTKIKKRLSQI